MTAPVTTARGTPVGVNLGDGFSTKIAFSLDADILLWEKTVQPTGLDGGDMIDVTTMHNVTYRTMRPRALITLTEHTFVAAYDPVVYDQIIAILNVEGDITLHFPDTDTLDFFGVLRLFIPSEHSEGSQPEATVTVTPTNVDPISGDEEGPVMTGTTGTS